MKEVDKFYQSRRILNILRLFQKNITLTTTEILDMLNDKFAGISKRSIQRDLKVLEDEGLIELEKRGQASVWKLIKNRKFQRPPINISGNEILSFYMLKAYISTFEGTTIEKDIKKLSDKIENLAPGDVFLEDTLYWNQNSGSYDYSMKPNIISILIQHIVEKNWVEISYQKMSDDLIGSYLILPCSLYTYNGAIYLVAYYSQSKKHHNFLIQNIIEVKESLNQSMKTPDFDYKDFKKKRFAVFGGDINKVKILIKKEFVKYFENRFWHSTQKMIDQKNGDVVLNMDVPVTPELLSWICSWSDFITVLEPPELKEQLVSRLKASLENYEEC